MFISTLRFRCNALLAAAALLIAVDGMASDTRRAVTEMREACSITHSLGGPAPIITSLTLFENGDAEWSLAANLKYRTAASAAEVQSVCERMVPLLDIAAGLAAIAKEQDDTELFWMSVGDRSGSLPRWKFTVTSTPDGVGEVVEEYAIPERGWAVLSSIDEWAKTTFGAAYSIPLVREDSGR